MNKNTILKNKKRSIIYIAVAIFDFIEIFKLNIVISR